MKSNKTYCPQRNQGCFALSTVDYEWTTEDMIGVIFRGIGANAFYLLGSLMELFNRYYFKNKIKITQKIRYIFLIGVILFSCFWTLLNTVIYFKIN